MQNTLFPIFLKTDQFKFLIVGGGNVGLEKAETLLRQNPEIKLVLVAKEIRPELKVLLNAHRHSTFHEKAYEDTDLDGCRVVIIATDNPSLNAKIKEKATEKLLFVNAADQPALCDFYLGSIVHKGNLKIGISTNGKSPTAAKRLKEVLNDVLPEEIDELLNNLNAIRNSLKGNFSEKITQLNEITKSLVEKNNL